MILLSTDLKLFTEFFTIQCDITPGAQKYVAYIMQPIYQISCLHVYRVSKTGLPHLLWGFINTCNVHRYARCNRKTCIQVPVHVYCFKIDIQQNWSVSATFFFFLEFKNILFVWFGTLQTNL